MIRLLAKRCNPRVNVTRFCSGGPMSSLHLTKRCNPRVSVTRFCSGGPMSSVHEAYGRIHVRGDNGKYQAHGPDGKYVGQFSTKDEAKKRLEELAGVPTVEEGPETKLDEQGEKTQIPEKQHSQQPIRGSDSMLEIEETPAPWTREDRSNQSRGERALENVNWVFRKSKGAYWVVAGVAGLGTLSALMGVWGK